MSSRNTDNLIPKPHQNLSHLLAKKMQTQNKRVTGGLENSRSAEFRYAVQLAFQLIDPLTCPRPSRHTPGCEVHQRNKIKEETQTQPNFRICIQQIYKLSIETILGIHKLELARIHGFSLTNEVVDVTTKV